MFEPIAELKLEEVFLKVIDALEERETGALIDIGEVLMELTKEYPKESIFLLSEIAKSSKSSKAREYAIDILSELALGSIEVTEKPEAPAEKEATEVSPGGEAGEYSVS